MNRTTHPIHHSFFAHLRDRVLGTVLHSDQRQRDRRARVTNGARFCREWNESGRRVTAALKQRRKTRRLSHALRYVTGADLDEAAR